MEIAVFNIDKACNVCEQEAIMNAVDKAWCGFCLEAFKQGVAYGSRKEYITYGDF